MGRGTRVAEHCSIRTPRQCKLQVSGNALHQVKFMYLGVVLTREGRRNEEIDIWICKANAVLREHYRSGITKRSFQTPQNCQLSYQTLFRSLPMNLGNYRKSIISSASGRDGIFAKSPWCGTSRQSALLCRDGFRKGGALGHLSFWGPAQV